MPRSTRRVVPSSLVALLAAGALQLVLPVTRVPAQPIAERPLPSATREFSYEFTNAVVVQPLRSGSVFVSDGSDATLVFLDARTGAGRVVGRIGSGPLEYRTAGQLLLLPGDSVAMYDVAQARMLIVSPTGQPVRTQSWGSDIMSALARPQPFGVDSRGRVFGLQLPPISPQSGMTIPESLPIARLASMTASRTDTVGRASQGQSYSAAPSMGADGKIHMAMPLSMILPADEPVVLPDGRLAVLRGDRYVVEWIADGAPPKVSAPVPSTRAPLSAADKKVIGDETRELMRTSMKAGARMLPAGQTMPEIVVDEPASWPTTRPHFLRGARAGFDGRLYVPVMCASAAEKCMDVLDASAKRVARYRLPKGSRLQAAGAGVVYLVGKDEDDLEYVRIHRIP